MKVFGAGLLSSAAELEFVMQGIQVSIKPIVSLFSEFVVQSIKVSV